MHHRIVGALRRLESDLAPQSDRPAILDACRTTGHTWRDRLLDPDAVLRPSLLQVLHGDTAITPLHWSAATRGRRADRREVPVSRTPPGAAAWRSTVSGASERSPRRNLLSTLGATGAAASSACDMPPVPIGTASRSEGAVGETGLALAWRPYDRYVRYKSTCRVESRSDAVA